MSILKSSNYLLDFVHSIGFMHVVYLEWFSVFVSAYLHVIRINFTLNHSISLIDF